jgi:lysophospholipase L1-like esterase
MKKEYFYYGIRLFLWALFFMLVMEFIIRTFIIKYPLQNKVNDLGIVPVDHSYIVWGLEGFGVTHFLSNGEIATPYDEGVSVVVLGDSFTEALQVADRQKYVSVAEELLHSRNIDVNLHNLGASGRSIADYVYIAPFIIDTYSPQIVIIQFSLTDFNESFDTSRVNYFKKHGEELELIHVEEEYTGKSIRNYLRMSGLVALVRYKIQPLVEAQIHKFRKLFATPVEVNLSANQDMPKVDQRAENIRMQIQALQDAYPDATLVFVIIPNIPLLQEGELVWQHQSDDFLITTLDQLQVSHVVYPQEYFRNLYCDEDKFPRGFFNTLPNYGHLNVDGNEALGQALADYLENVFK